MGVAARSRESRQFTTVVVTASAGRLVALPHRSLSREPCPALSSVSVEGSTFVGRSWIGVSLAVRAGKGTGVWAATGVWRDPSLLMNTQMRRRVKCVSTRFRSFRCLTAATCKTARLGNRGKNQTAMCDSLCGTKSRLPGRCSEVLYWHPVPWPTPSSGPRCNWLLRLFESECAIAPRCLCCSLFGCHLKVVGCCFSALYVCISEPALKNTVDVVKRERPCVFLIFGRRCGCVCCN